MNLFKSIFLLSITLLALNGCGSADTGSSDSTPTTKPLRMLIPLYSYPTDENGEIWNRVALAAQKVSITVLFGVIRGHNEPVGTPNSDYSEGLTLLRNAGITLLAYVETSDGTRDKTEVKADVKAYSENFDIDGIFYDEVSGSFDDFDYYEELIAYAKSFTKVREVMLNSSYIEKEYIEQSSSDSFIVFENSYPYWPDFDAVPYDGIAAEKLNAIVHTVPDIPTMQTAIDAAISKNIGNIYITDEEFHFLPTYFEEEVDYIAERNSEKR